MDCKQNIIKAYKENKSQNTPYKSFFKREAQRAESEESIEPVDFFNGCMFVLDQYKNEIICKYEKHYQENDLVVKSIEVGKGINIEGEHVTDLKDERIIATLDSIKKQKEFVKKGGYKNNLDFSCTLDSTGNIEKSCFLTNEHVTLYWIDLEQIEKGIVDAKDELIPNKKSKVNESKQTEPKVIDKEALGAYFSPRFKGMGNGNLDYLSMFVDELKTPRSRKEFAQIAALCYEGRQMNDRKPRTFAKWRDTFGEIVGRDLGTYDSKEKLLDDIDRNLKNLFSYLS